ncbi:MAG: RHS repeat-associated core domain-containing protein [Ignavibacteriae bacterium]|nr:RHS repeat-associated core domain-containing protein [Ignavibacteriota bacterium]NOG99256.1 RHS repeat-associated core domain-containing protein [Ignavibacteriota bacterium]
MNKLLLIGMLSLLISLQLSAQSEDIDPVPIFTSLVVNNYGVNAITVSTSFSGSAADQMEWSLDESVAWNELSTDKEDSLRDGFNIFINIGQLSFGEHTFKLRGRFQSYSTFNTINKVFNCTYGLVLNSIESKTILYPITNENEIAGLAANKIQKSISYSNNNGKQIQNIAIASSPSQKDVIAFTRYDNIGIASTNFLPYVDLLGTADGSYRPDAEDEQNGFYSSPPQSVASSSYPYAKRVYELSPLLRDLEQGAPGEAWQPGSATIKTDYLTNSADEVLYWKVDVDDLILDNYYSENTLFKTKITDENGKVSYIYKDKNDREILKVSMFDDGVENVAVSTYYVYDEKGNLRFVIPPEAVEELGTTTSLTLIPNPTTPTIRSKWITEYKYDGYNRQIEKIMPEEEVVTTVYDPLGRVVLRQDGLFRANNDWLFTKYDKRGRVIMTGSARASGPLTRQQMQDIVTDGIELGTYSLFEERSETGKNYYTNNAIPHIDECDVWTVNYYDDYDFNNDGTDDVTFDNPTDFADADYDEAIGGYNYWIEGHTPFDRVKGKLTKTMVKVFEDIDGVFEGDESYNECPPSPNTLYYHGNVTLTAGFRTVPGQEVFIGPNIVVPTGTGKEPWLESVTFYDDDGRVIQTQSTNHMDMNAVDVASTQYDFSGKVMRTKLEHMKNNVSYALNITNRFTYDHAGRLIKTYQKNHDDSEQLISQNYYNELGQLTQKSLHEDAPGVSTFHQSFNYRYNIRGWLTQVNDPLYLSGDDLFSYKLLYNELNTNISNEQLFNGNISAMLWKYDKGDKIYPEAYSYVYDDLGRLTNANYFTYNSNWVTSNNYKVDELYYDLHGNIQTIRRTDSDGSVIDYLDYDYDQEAPNKLYKVEDTAPSSGDMDFIDGVDLTEEYIYDGNGNMIEDKNKGIDIVYNYLNLPKKITWNDGRKIEWLYSAIGSKLRRAVYSSDGSVEEVTDYVNGFVYESDYTEALPELKFFNFSEGRVVNEGGFDYEYYLKDHLGNVRVSFRGSATAAEIEQADFYYPFGMRERRKVAGDENKELYNGKELVDNHNLFWYHYGARYYDPQLGRWHAMDPVDELNSPYVYSLSDPINFLDPDGRAIERAGKFIFGYEAQNITLKIMNDVISGIDSRIDFQEADEPFSLRTILKPFVSDGFVWGYDKMGGMAQGFGGKLDYNYWQTGKKAFVQKMIVDTKYKGKKLSISSRTKSIGFKDGEVLLTVFFSAMIEKSAYTVPVEVIKYTGKISEIKNLLEGSNYILKQNGRNILDLDGEILSEIPRYEIKIIDEPTLP